jgi:hypothetical protein
MTSIYISMIGLEEERVVGGVQACDFNSVEMCVFFVNEEFKAHPKVISSKEKVNNLMKALCVNIVETPTL